MFKRDLRKAGGLKLAKEVYYRAGFESAYKYCQTRRELNKLSGIETVRRYLSSMSVRDWGKFQIVEIDGKKGTGYFRLYRLGLSEEYGSVKRTVCHWVRGPWPGLLGEFFSPYLLNRCRLLLEIIGIPSQS